MQKLPNHRFEFFITFTSDSVLPILEDKEFNKYIRHYKKIKLLSQFNIHKDLKEYIEKNFLKKRYTKKLFCIIEKDRNIGLIKFYLEKNIQIINIDTRINNNRLFRKIIKKFDFMHKITYLFENDSYRTRFLELYNIDPEQCHVAGTLKAIESNILIDLKNENSNSFNIIYLSAHTKDIKVIYKIISSLKSVNNKLIKHIILPRYIKNIDGDKHKALFYIEKTIGNKNINKFINLINKRIHTIEVTDYEDFQRDTNKLGVFVVKKLGETEKFLSISNIAIVCNTFFPSSKGHNIYEPLSAEVPTFLGKYYKNWADSIFELKNKELLLIKDLNELDSAIKEIIVSPKKYQEYKDKLKNSQELKDLKESAQNISDYLCNINNK